MQFYGAVPSHDLTYSDVFLVPSQSGIRSRLDVSLAPGDGTGATIPVVSANMNSVTGPRLAAALARRGYSSSLVSKLVREELDAEGAAEDYGSGEYGSGGYGASRPGVGEYSIDE